MAFQPAPNIMGIEVRMVCDGEPIENTIAFSNGQPFIRQDITAVCVWVVDQFLDGHVPITPSAVQYIQAYGSDLGTSDGETAEVNFPANTIGGLVLSAEPNEVSFFIKFKASGKGRTNFGGNYWPALAKTHVTGSLLNVTQADAMVAFYNGMRATAFASTGFRMGFVSRRINNAARPAGVFKETLQCSYSDLLVDSQRGRKPGSN